MVLQEPWQISKGCLENARQLPSDNCNERPPSALINLLVIHNISLPAGEFGNAYIEQLFTNCLPSGDHPSFVELQGLEVSAHLLIRRDGQVTQFVPFDQRAWHAGVSRFLECDNCNDFSIGIELEGTDYIPYTELQYQHLAGITQALMRKYPAINTERIVGHCDIAPDRKTDPGPAFDWQYFHRLLSFLNKQSQ
jgi:AmpD protein